MAEHNTSAIKRAVIFDFGGVLMKTTDYRPRHAWDAHLGLPTGTVEHVVHGSDAWRQAQTGKLEPDDYWVQVAHRLGLDTSETAKLRHDFFLGDQLDHNLIKLIGELKNAGHTVGLLSNDTLELRDKLQALGIGTLFAPLLISAAIGVMKPDALAFHMMLSALQRPAVEVIFIDDMPDNVAAARALGIQGVHYERDMDLESALAPLLHIPAEQH